VIFGIGTDIVRIARMQENLVRFGEKFAERILTENELREYHLNNNKANFLGRRFAAKEAVAKAMGTGLSRGITLHDIEVAHDSQGKPVLVFRGNVQKFMEEKAITVTHISLADEQDHAVAFVTLEKS